jgi:hypothetical protein
MKAELTKDGIIVISPETVAEAFAIRHILPKADGESCGNCGHQDVPVVFNCNMPDIDDSI